MDNPDGRYSVIERLGAGAFGTVFLVKNNEESKLYALKVVSLEGRTPKQIFSVRQELTLLQNLTHPNVVGYKEHFMLKPFVIGMVLQYCGGGDLSHKIQSAKECQTPFPEPTILKWFLQATLGLHYMHSRNVLHRDIKGGNLFLLAKGNRVVVGDFGMSKELDESSDLTKTQCGTPVFMSPEMFHGKPYSFKSDVWGLGCLLYEMTFLKLPFNAYSLVALSQKVMAGNYTLPETSRYSDELRNLIRAMLSVDPDQRPALSNVLHFPIVKKALEVYLREALDEQMVVSASPRKMTSAGTNTSMSSPRLDSSSSGNGDVSSPTTPSTPLQRQDSSSQQRATAPEALSLMNQLTSLGLGDLVRKALKPKPKPVWYVRGDGSVDVRYPDSAQKAIEEAFQYRSPSVDITIEVNGEQKAYKVLLEYNPDKFTQMNASTGFLRLVKRIAGERPGSVSTETSTPYTTEQMPDDFKPSESTIDWTLRYNGHIAKLHYDLKRKTVILPPQGIVICAKSKDGGKSVFYKIKLKFVKASCKIEQLPADFDITTSDLPDWTKKYDASVGKAKEAVENGDVLLPPSGILIRSERLTNQNRENVYFKISTKADALEAERREKELRQHASKMSETTQLGYSLVPDLLDGVVITTHALTVKYPDVMICGNKIPQLTASQTHTEPQVILIEPKSSALYTLIKTDPDAPSRSEPTFREFVHHVVVNIPAPEATKSTLLLNGRGDTVLPYVGCGAPYGSGCHRYVWMLFEQSDMIIRDTAKIFFDGRGGKRAMKFAKAFGLQGPVAMTAYEGHWDDSVDALHQELGFMPDPKYRSPSQRLSSIGLSANTLTASVALGVSADSLLAVSSKRKKNETTTTLKRQGKTSDASDATLTSKASSSDITTTTTATTPITTSPITTHHPHGKTSQKHIRPPPPKPPNPTTPTSSPPSTTTTTTPITTHHSQKHSRPPPPKPPNPTTPTSSPPSTTTTTTSSSSSSPKRKTTKDKGPPPPLPPHPPKLYIGIYDTSGKSIKASAEPDAALTATSAAFEELNMALRGEILISQSGSGSATVLAAPYLAMTELVRQVLVILGDGKIREMVDKDVTDCISRLVGVRKAGKLYIRLEDCPNWADMRRLHRVLYFIYLFMELLLHTSALPVCEAARKAYRASLSFHHDHLTRAMVSVAVKDMPSRSDISTLCPSFLKYMSEFVKRYRSVHHAVQNMLVRKGYEVPIGR